MFRLLRHFVATSLLAFVIVLFLLGLLYNQRATADLVQLEEGKNVALTRAIANALRDDLQAFVALSSEKGADELRQHPVTAQLRNAILDHMAGQSIVKVKVYAMDGTVAFSTESAQIGDDQGDNPGFQSALAGRVVSQQIHRDQFNAFDGIIENRDMVSSYVPVFTNGSQAEVEGVFELYSDVTPLLDRIGQTQRAILLSVTLILGALYLFLFLVVRRADRIIQLHAKELNQARDTAEAAIAIKNEFLSFVAHELKAPIAVVKTYLDLLSRGNRQELNDRQLDYLETINANINRVTALASDLSDISRMEAGALLLQFEPVSVPELVQDVAQSLSNLMRQKGQSLKLDIASDLPPVLADRNRISQVMTNLVSNANKYTPAGGQIKVSARTLSDNGMAGMIEISVQDNGIGIEAREQSKIFERFFRSEDGAVRQVDGTGLGLHIARNLAELQGGRLWFESEFRNGTTFHLALPSAAS
jgi:signal transduction histidine kinase